MIETEMIELEMLTRTQPFVVVGIPAFNEEKSIAAVVIEAQKFAHKVIVCDDGSTDLTAEIADHLGADVIKHRRNLGYGASIKTLFKRANDLSADVLVTLDADGQHDPREVPEVINPILNGEADLVIGSRFIDVNGTAEMPAYRRIGAQLITMLVNGSSKNGISDAQSGFRAYGRQALERLAFSEAGMGASVEILLKASKENLKIYEVPCSCKYNNGDVETSSENPIHHGMGVVASIIRLVVEDRPLLFLGIPALFFMIAGLFFGGWMLQIYAAENRIVTNLALASMSFILIAFFLSSTAITLYAISRISRRQIP